MLTTDILAQIMSERFDNRVVSTKQIYDVVLKDKRFRQRGTTYRNPGSARAAIRATLQSACPESLQYHHGAGRKYFSNPGDGWWCLRSDAANDGRWRKQ